MSKWISVKDDKPTYCERVLVYLPRDSGYITSAYLEHCTYLDRERWTLDDENVLDFNKNFITHWMTLPPPPKD